MILKNDKLQPKVEDEKNAKKTQKLEEVKKMPKGAFKNQQGTK